MDIEIEKEFSYLFELTFHLEDELNNLITEEN